MSNRDRSSITRDNHYVPRATLKRWSRDGKTVFAHRLLVSHQSVPLWQRMPVGGVAYQRDLYTIVEGHREHDDVERWANEYERPADAAIDTVLRGERLKRDDWHSLAMFVALQDLRTPRQFFESMKRWEKTLPEVFESTTRDALNEFKRAKENNVPLEHDTERNEFSDLIEAKIVKSQDASSSERTIRTEAILGRRFWIASMRHVLGGVAKVLREHQWTIIEPAGEAEWPLTDHPVVKLNYRGPRDYNFGGGWGRRRGNILLPLTPRHLLFTQIGDDFGRRITSTNQVTRFFQQVLVQRAHRWVFATEPAEWITKVVPRRVDPVLFDQEREAWATWHVEQSKAEQAP